MKKTVPNLIASVICIVLYLIVPKVVYADAGASAAAAAAAWAIKKADEEGLFDCALHLGANQCRRLDRCRRALTALKRAEDGSETALKQLDSFIGASSMQRNCIRSLEGGHFSALMENLEQLNKPEYENRRSASSNMTASIFNPWLKKYLGVHENGQIVMWPRNTGSGEKWNLTNEGCIYSPWLKKYLGVHESGEIVMWPRCSVGEKWQVKNDGCIFNPFLQKYLGVHETGEIVMWPRCSTGEKWQIR